jgi:glutamyl-Q tRNA(Asp) synthetase
LAGATPQLRYRGRFAPSPTGLLHFGSLVAAVASYADARAHRGDWLVRMDDLDHSRAVGGAADAILRALEAFGLNWDGDIIYQSDRTERYDEVLDQLRRDGLVYPCACSRKLVSAEGRPGQEGPIYSGRCRDGLRSGQQPRSERIRVAAGPVTVEDRIHGTVEQHLCDDVGDFVVLRADGIHAYQLSVVVDDADMGVNQVVRGADLLMSTPRQVYLQRCLGLPEPSYAHVPLAVDSTGRKLSKSLADLPVDPADPVPALLRAWDFLGQPRLESRPATARDFWAAAIPRWRIADLPRQRSIDVSTVRPIVARP